MSTLRPGWHPDTVAVVAGSPDRVVDAPLNPPVVFASTYVGSSDPTDELGYGRYGNPTWTALEAAVGALEGGSALAFASGMAAATAVLELIGPGATVVLPGNCYLGVSALVDHRAERLGWTVRRVAVADTDEVLAASRDADLVWMESPTNPLIDVADLPAVGAGVPRSALLIVDNTFATPLLQRPLDLGASIVLHSGTKFMGGHSDALMGLLITAADRPELGERLGAIRRMQGAIAGPMEAYLVLRGLRTMPLRLERAQASAMVLAERLAAHPAVRRVRFPGLAADPGHAVAARGMAGFGALLSIELADGPTADAFIERLGLWVSATSLGGIESTLERRRRWAGELAVVPEGLVRLSVGIEYVEDLWADLAQSLDAV